MGIEKNTSRAADPSGRSVEYEDILADLVSLLEEARRAAARSVNTVATATYWAMGWRIVEHEQAGRARARYGEALIERLSEDLTARFGRGFGRRNLFQMKAFYLAYREKVQRLSALSPSPADPGIVRTASALSPGALPVLAAAFPLPRGF